MTTTRQLTSNRQNALQSTGPQSQEGKAKVTQNAIQHGIFSLCPVVPGETKESWQQHRTGLYNQFLPQGDLEKHLVERIALLLWRMNRLTRYEIHLTRYRMDTVKPFDPTSREYSSSDPHRLVIHRYEEQEQQMADRQLILDYLQQWDQLPQDTPITPNVSWILLEQAVGLSPSHRGFGSNPKLLSLLNLSSWDDWEEIDWELCQVQSRLPRLAQHVGCSVNDLLSRVAESIRTDLATMEVEQKQRQKRYNQARRKLAQQVHNQQMRQLLGDTKTTDKIIRYENHLHRQLLQTIHELERLQALRLGWNVSTPMALDITVSGNPNSD